MLFFQRLFCYSIRTKTVEFVEWTGLEIYINPNPSWFKERGDVGSGQQSMAELAQSQAHICYNGQKWVAGLTSSTCLWVGR